MENKKLLDVLGGTAAWPPPVWLMRQAGRYLPEFRALRSQADFITRCTTPDLATEITLQPLRRFAMDGAILFSDILMLPWAMGQSLAFVENEGPVLGKIRSEADVDALQPGRVADATAPIIETVRRVRRALDADHPGCTLLGFAGSPFTVACYMVEGGGSREFLATRRMAYMAPDLFDRLIGILVDVTVDYLSAQIEAGADAVMLFDSWSGVLPPTEFRRSVIAPTRAIVDALALRHPKTPVVGFPRLAGLMIEPYAQETGVRGVGIDTATDLGRASKLLPPGIAMQGNLDPLRLVAGGRELTDTVTDICRSLRGRPHVFNLGHGVLPETPPEHVAMLLDAVRAA